LNARQVAGIVDLVNHKWGASRQELALTLCRRFRWRRANGSLAIRNAQELLKRLGELGVIKLPAPRHGQGRSDRGTVKAAAALLSDEGEGDGAPPGSVGGSALEVRPIERGERLGWRAHVERFHYLGDGVLVGESLRYVAIEAGRWVALLGWHAASLHNTPRDRYVGWEPEQRRANLSQVVNNSRFVVLPWARRANLASQVLGANLRRLSRDWEKRYGHSVVLAESFVDISRFRGTCYQASNWRRVGETQGWAKRGRSYHFHGEVKSVWLYPLRRDFNKHLCAVAPPDKERFMVVDVERLPLEGEGGLFDVLGTIPDPRKRRGIRHKIPSIIASALCAVLGGARSITAMAQWAAEQSPETLRRLGSRRGKPPSERTYRRTFAAIDTATLDRLVGAWMVAQGEPLSGRVLAIDGKTVRGSAHKDNKALHLLSAIVHDSATVVAQVAVSSKTNEITQVEPLFEHLDIEGAVVTADALLTQTKIAEHLVKVKHADYVFVAKDNQPTLRRDIATLGLDAFPPSARNDR